MKNKINRIFWKSFKPLALAALGVLAMAQTAQARDHDQVDVGVHADDHGDFGVNLNIFGGHDHPAPPPVVVVRERTERIWVDPVWRNDGDRAWVDAVYKPVTDRVWHEPVTRDVVERVWVDAVYEVRDVTHGSHGFSVTVRERVCVSPGHYEERHHAVVVTDGHWDNVEHWVLVSDGHWENHEHWVMISDGHWEDHVIHEAPPTVHVEERVHIRG